MHQTFVPVRDILDARSLRHRPTSRIEKNKSNSLPPRSAKRHMDRVAPPNPILKTQKSDTSCVSNFFASGLFHAAPSVKRVPPRCPLYPQKQTSELSRVMSALCQKRTHAPQQFSSLFGHRVDHSSAAAAVTCSELFVESVLDEIIQHPVGLKRRRRIKFGNALHHSFFFGKGA